MIAAHDLNTYSTHSKKLEICQSSLLPDANTPYSAETDVSMTVTFDSVCIPEVLGTSCIVSKYPAFHLLIAFAKGGIFLVDV